MSRIHRLLAALVPSSRRDWINAHEAELGSLETRVQRYRWTVGLLGVTVSALWAQLRASPRSYLGGTLARTMVVAMSISNIIAGAGLTLLFVRGSGRPGLLLAFSLALAAQGGYTLALITGAFRARSRVATRLQIAASTLALVVGATGFGIAFARNINPAIVDPEYGPMAVALLFAAHALASFVAFTGSPDADIRTA